MFNHEVERKMRDVPVRTPVVIELNGKHYDIKEMEWQGWENSGFTIVRLVGLPDIKELIQQVAMKLTYEETRTIDYVSPAYAKMRDEIYKRL